MFKKTTAFAMALALLLTGCSGSKPEGDIPIESGFEFTSNITEDFTFSELDLDETSEGINSFAVMDDSKTALITFSDEKGSCFVIYENGKESFRKEISPFYRELCYDPAENRFFTYKYDDKQLCVMDAEFDPMEILAEDFDPEDLRSMDIVDNKLYLIAVEKDPFLLENQADGLNSDTGYTDFGEKAYSIDLSTKKLEDLGIQNVICQSYSNGTLYYYTCRDGHYSLDVFDRASKTLKSVRNMDDMGYIYSFAVIGGEFLYCNPSAGVLKKLDLNTGSQTAEAGSMFIIRNSQFEVYKGALIYLNNNTINRYGGNASEELPTGNIAQYNGESLVIGYQSAYDAPLQTGEINKACGVSASIHETPVYDNELSLELLSGSSEVDIYIFPRARGLGGIYANEAATFRSPTSP